MKRLLCAILAAVTILLVACSRQATAPATADRVFLNGVVYTADPGRSVATALAIAGERIVYVGDNAGAQALVGDATEVVDLAGRMLLPGLHDMHIHLMGIIPAYDCDLDSQPLNLEALSGFVADCAARNPPAAGEWLIVDQWRFSDGNNPVGELRTLRQALDAAVPNNPVFMWGDDGHHSAANSLALAGAVNEAGQVVGLNRETLAADFSAYRQYVGVDGQGEPNGAVNETARNLLQPPPWRAVAGLPPERMPLVAQALARSGITSVQEGATNPATLPLYQSLLDTDQLTFNMDAALWQESPAPYTDAAGKVDIAAMIAELEAVRREYRDVPGISTDSVKVFVDGVLEGNPLSDPPTLPNAAVLSPFQQPRFRVDAEAGHVELLGYVDTAGEVCQTVRAESGRYSDLAAVSAFRAEHGFHPAQCEISRGVLEHDRQFILDYMQALDAAGFKIHAHVIGDRAVRTALDGIEALRRSNGDSGLKHSLVHVQLVAPEDYQRIGELGLYLAFSFGWAQPDAAYDMTVNPFIDQLSGNEGLYRADSYYMRNLYPAGQLLAAGAIPVSGSDAPVDSRDPRPFYNIQAAVTRGGDSGVVMNPDARLEIAAALDAYTIWAAEMFGHADQTGSLEVGKYADLVVVDRDLLALAQSGRADQIGEAQVQMTLFRGREVFRAP